MDSPNRGRGGYNRGRGGGGRGRWQGYRGRGHSGGGNIQDGLVGDQEYEQSFMGNRGGYGGNQMNRGQMRCGGMDINQGRGGWRPNIRPNTNFINRNVPNYNENQQYGNQMPNQMPGNFPNHQAAFAGHVRMPQMPNYLQNQMPQMMEGEEVEVTEVRYKIKHKNQPGFSTPQPPPSFIQQSFQQQSMANPPPGYDQMPQNFSRSQSLQSVRAPFPRYNQRQRNSEQDSNGPSFSSAGDHTIARSRSAQNVDLSGQHKGARPKEIKSQRGRQRDHDKREQTPQKTSYNGKEEHVSDSQNIYPNDEMVGHNRSCRGRGGRRGRGPRSYKRGATSNRSDEDVNDKHDTSEQADGIKTVDRRTSQNVPMRARGTGRQRGSSRTRRGAPVANVPSKDVAVSDNESGNETPTEENDDDAREPAVARILTRGRGRGYIGRGSFRRGRNRYIGHNNYTQLRSDLPKKRHDSESSDVSSVSTIPEDFEASTIIPSATGDATRAGTEGIDSISIQTIRNRIFRYRRKLNEKKKQKNPDPKKIAELQNIISDIEHVLQKRIKDEKESRTTEGKDKAHARKESVVKDQVEINEHEKNDTFDNVSCSDDTASESSKHRISYQRKHKFVSTSKKGTVSFRPKTKRKHFTSPTQRLNTSGEDATASKNEVSLELDEDDEETLGSVISDNEAGQQPQPTSSKRRPRKRRNKKLGSQQENKTATDDTPDWQEKLETLCLSDTDEAQKVIGTLIYTDVSSVKGKTSELNSKGKNQKTERIGKTVVGTKRRDSDLNTQKQNATHGKGTGRSTENVQQIDADIHDADIAVRRHRSESSLSDSVTDAGPDEVEVFKFLVKDFNGEGCPTKLKESCGMFKDCWNVNEWFRRHSRKFLFFEKEKIIIKVCVFVRDASYCLDYITQKGCTKSGCPRYHICKNLLCGYCTFGDHCKFSHDSLDKHNFPISNQLGFCNLFDNRQIHRIVSLRFPHVCESWNSTGGCTDTVCCKLHICQRHVFGNCLEGDGCPFEHSLTTEQNQMVTKAYNMSNWNTKLFNRLIFVTKRGSAPVGRSGEEAHAAEEPHEAVLDEGAVARPLHTRPGRRQRKIENADTSFLSTDTGSDLKFLCQKQLIGQCDVDGCLKYHGDTAGLPYVWQVKIYGTWVTLPEGQAASVEAEFCGSKEKSGSTILASEDGLYQEITIHFHPNISAYIKPFDIDGEKMITDARRLSTPSYAEDDLVGLSFKTQWRWSWVDDRGMIQLFDSEKFQYTLEKKYLSGQKTYLYSRENYRFKYGLDFNEMTQVNLDTWKSRKVFRRPLLVEKTDVLQRKFPAALTPPTTVSVPLPENWAVWDLAHPFELIELDSSQLPYKDVEEQFYKTLDRVSFNIVQIYRVQNPLLWSAYTNFKAMKTNNAERMLFHGTDSLDTVRGIAINNFDHRISGKNATMYGEGAYFAKTAKYSHAYTKPPERFMFLARVMVGDYTKGDPSFKRPPSKAGAAHELYDSCVNDVNSPSIFIVFDTKQYYPEFLIQYKSVADRQNVYDTSYDQQLFSIPQPVSSDTGLVYPRAPQSPTYDTQAPGFRNQSPPTYHTYPSMPLSYPSYPSSTSMSASQAPGKKDAEQPRKSKEKEPSCVVQ